jgi:hypothetical protein
MHVCMSQATAEELVCLKVAVSSFTRAMLVYLEQLQKSSVFCRIYMLQCCLFCYKERGYL